MRQASELYKQLRTQTGSYYEVKIVRGDVTYGMNKLKSITIGTAMFEGNGPQIGGVYSTQCNVKILERSINWPRGAAFEVFIRITDGTEFDDWISIGTYYTDERHSDKYGNLDIIAFDAMLLLERPWTDKVEIPPEWPVTAQSACSMLSAALGIQFDSRTVLDNTVPFIGLNTTATARDTLAAVAAGMGGNWHVAPEGKLRLIPLAVPPEDVRAIAGIAVAGVSVVGDTTISDDDGKRYIDLGLKVKDIDIGNATGSITTVELQASGVDSKNAIARASDGDGYILKGKCDFSNSDVAALCLSKVEGYVYKPFSATSARLDPIAELGDLIQIDGDTYQLVSINWRIGPHITADISAPFEEAVDHEYPMLSESAKNLHKAVNYTNRQIESTRSYITQTAQSITQGVAATYVSNQALANTLQEYSPTEQIEQNYYNKSQSDSQASALASEIQLTDSRLSIAFSQLRSDTDNALNAMTYYIRYENGVVIIGKTDDPTSVQIANNKISLYYGSREISYWDSSKQYTPTELQIPTGGKFTLGNIVFQPRSSGNMSCMWVGN